MISLRERCLHDEVLKRRCLLKKSTFSKAFTGFIIFASSSEVPLSRWQRKEQLPQTDEQPVIFYFQVHVCAAHMITKPLKLVPLIQLGLDLQQLRRGPTCGEDVCGHGQESVRHDALRRHRDVELPRYVAVNVGPEVLQLITWTKQKRSNEKELHWLFQVPLCVPLCIQAKPTETSQSASHTGIVDFIRIQNPLWFCYCSLHVIWFDH